MAIASGPVIGGAITQGIDWHWIFWVNVPIGLVAVALSRGQLRETRGPSSRLDLAGLVLVTAAALSLVWALVRSGAAGWGSAEVLVTLLAGVGLLGAFVTWERRAPAPMLPPRLFSERTFAAANATAFLMIAAIMGAAFLVAQYFQLALGDSPLATGLRLLPWTATPIAVTPAAGALSDRVGPRPIMALGMLLQAAGLGWFALLATGTVGYGTLVVPLIIAGVGISMALPTTTAAALGSVTPAELGKASGANSTLQRFGGAFGVAIAAAMFSAHGHLGTAAGFDSGFRPALATLAGISLIGVATSMLVGVRRRRVSPVGVDAAPAAALSS
jgi:MFS family permease